MPGKVNLLRPLPRRKTGCRAEGAKAETGARCPPEPLTLTVPPEMPLDADLYIVKKGDTLWAISKRFTGDPFNYPRVARDNKIANPDLIFPDQKIYLKGNCSAADLSSCLKR